MAPDSIGAASHRGAAWAGAAVPAGVAGTIEAAVATWVDLRAVTVTAFIAVAFIAVTEGPCGTAEALADTAGATAAATKLAVPCSGGRARAAPAAFHKDVA